MCCPGPASAVVQMSSDEDAGAAAAVIGESGGSFIKGLISALPSHCLQTCPSGEASSDVSRDGCACQLL